MTIYTRVTGPITELGMKVVAFSDVPLNNYYEAVYNDTFDTLFDPLMDIWQNENGVSLYPKADYDALLAAQEAGFKDEYLSKLTVTTTNGNTFKANNDGQNILLRDIMSLEFSSGTEKQVVLSDGTIATISLTELKEALTLAVEATTAILVS